MDLMQETEALARIVFDTKPSKEIVDQLGWFMRNFVNEVLPNPDRITMPWGFYIGGGQAFVDQILWRGKLLDMTFGEGFFARLTAFLSYSDKLCETDEGQKQVLESAQRFWQGVLGREGG